MVYHERAKRVEWWAGKDSNLRRRKPSDLQSDAFGHFATDPRKLGEYTDFTERSEVMRKDPKESTEELTSCAIIFTVQHYVL